MYRALVLILCGPLLKRIGYRLPWQFIIVSAWSGLRGAVGLALALMVYETEETMILKDTVSYFVSSTPHKHSMCIFFTKFEF